MKKLKVLLMSAVLVVMLCACGGAAEDGVIAADDVEKRAEKILDVGDGPSEPYFPGERTETSYVSKFGGYSFNAPEGYNIWDCAKEFYGVKEGMTDKQIIACYEGGSTFTEVILDGYPSVSVTVSVEPEMGAGYVASMKEGDCIDTITVLPTEQVTFLDRTCMKYNTYDNVADKYTSYYVYINEGYYVTFTFSWNGGQEEEQEQLLACFSPN